MRRDIPEEAVLCLLGPELPPPVAFQTLCSCHGASARPLPTLFCGLVPGPEVGPDLLHSWPTRLNPIEQATWTAAELYLSLTIHATAAASA